MIKRIQVDINGRVQGVGFRPYVARLASQYNLSGWVRNVGNGVTIAIQGTTTEAFFAILTEQLPSLARIDTMTTMIIPCVDNEMTFVILSSDCGNTATQIPPDTAICPACLDDLFNPQSHYYHYPFISCVQCGPRYSTLHSLPYDRQRTSFSSFPLCQRCCIGYHNPHDRRYQAQTIGCNECGPQLSHSLETISAALLAGKIIALKSLSGYHLLVDGCNSESIRRLRDKKRRPQKPLALMALNSNSIKPYAFIDSTAQQVLSSPTRPIVLLPKKPCSLVKANHQLADTIAPGLGQFGFMLPYTGLHYLLFYYLMGQPTGTSWLQQSCSYLLINTSGNVSGSAIITDDAVAIEQLSQIADIVVTHNRNISIRADDSVFQILRSTIHQQQKVKQNTEEKIQIIRRSRGLVPDPIELAHEIPNTLALGSLLKNTICITRGCEAFISSPHGDLNNVSSIQAFHDSLRYWQRYLNIKPERLVVDKHPDYYLRRYADSLSLPGITVQHHHAHLAQVAAEHHLSMPAIGLALDGFGYGDDGQAWGGELMYYHHQQCLRIGHLFPLALIGNDRAAKQCWRMAVSLLLELNATEQLNQRFSQYPWQELVTLASNSSIIKTSSCGRWFDAVSALLGVAYNNHYESEAAIKLEHCVTEPLIVENSYRIHNHILDLLPLAEFLLSCDAILGANYFHGTLIAALSDWVIRALQQYQLNTVILSGGCFNNQVLRIGIINQLEQANYRVYISQQLPCDDAGLSLGQAWLIGSEC